MPKIIENLQSRLIQEARKQVLEAGYSALTMRSVASSCGVSVGTVYNYFPSKDILFAHCLLEDWREFIAAIDAVNLHAQTPEPLVRCIYQQLQGLESTHYALFQDAKSATSFSGFFSKYRSNIRAHLAKPLEKHCETPFAAEFIAEALLTWAFAGQDFDTVYGIIQKLFRSEWQSGAPL